MVISRSSSVAAEVVAGASSCMDFSGTFDTAGVTSAVASVFAGTFSFEASAETGATDWAGAV